MSAPPRYACGRCGTWTCEACGWQRSNTDIRYVNYPCGRCRGLAGTLVPTMHTAKMWLKHNQGLPPTAYAYGERPPAEEWGPGFGERNVPQPPHYRGVPVSRVLRDNWETPQAMWWRAGVDAALDSRKDDDG